MKRKQSTVILSAAMAAMMLMSGCGKDGGSAQQETATKNADGNYHCKTAGREHRKIW